MVGVAIPFVDEQIGLDFLIKTSNPNINGCMKG
jgi:hypothetical protein